MKKVVLFSMNGCSGCAAAKKYFDSQQISYRLCNIKSPAGAKEFARLRLRGVPVIKIGDQLLQGFSIKGFNQLYNA